MIKELRDPNPFPAKQAAVEYPLSSVTDAELQDYVDYVLQEMWNVLTECKGGHPYFWAIHNLYGHLEEIHDGMGIREFVDDVFEGDPEEFVPWFNEVIAGMELLLRAGKGMPAPRVCEKPILDYLRRSNRARHLTEIIGMLAHEYDIHLDRGRLSSYLSTLQGKSLVRNRMCPVMDGTLIERGYWWADGEEGDAIQLAFDWTQKTSRTGTTTEEIEEPHANY